MPKKNPKDVKDYLVKATNYKGDESPVYEVILRMGSIKYHYSWMYIQQIAGLFGAYRWTIKAVRRGELELTIGIDRKEAERLRLWVL